MLQKWLWFIWGPRNHHFSPLAPSHYVVLTTLIALYWPPRTEPCIIRLPFLRRPYASMEETWLLPFFPDPDIPEDVRLVDGPGRCQGRVEVLYQLEWNSVCKAGWNLQASKVACRQLGCGRALLTRACCNKTTQGKGPIWASQMSCAGQEANLRDCPFRSLEKNCTHDEDAWVECEGNRI